MVQSPVPGGLRVSTDAVRGLRRERAGKGFRYRDARGQLVTDAATLDRIRSLAIPPAYREVWISALPESHLQATGIDARGRKQYRYHPKWRELRDADKFHRVLAFAKALPALRRRAARDLLRRDLGHDKVVATLVILLEATLIRVGNEAYARENHHYGLTTLQERHVALHGEQLRFRFTGKSGVERDVEVRDRRLASVVKGLLELPGQQLFRYRDPSGRLRRVRSEDVNDYLRQVTGRTFTAKDFRTWAGTVFCATALVTLTRNGVRQRPTATVRAAVKEVAARLGNTPAVCRKAYIHPTIIDTYLSDGLQTLAIEPPRSLDFRRHLHAAEGQVLELLERVDSDRRRQRSRALRAPAK